MDPIIGMARILSLPAHCISRSRLKPGRVYLSNTIDVDVSDYIVVVAGVYVKPGLEGFDEQFVERQYILERGGEKVEERVLIG